MKRYSAADILYHVLVPLVTYLLTGLMFLKCSAVSINSTYYVVWGIMAGIIVGIKEYFANRTVTICIGIYVVFVVIRFGIFSGEENKIHAAMVVLGLLAVYLLKIIYRFTVVKVLSGYVFLISLICFDLAGVSFSKGIIALAIVLFLNSVSETISAFYRGNANSFIIIYTVIATMTVIIPAPQEPYDWGFVIRAVEAADKMLNNIILEIQYQWGVNGSDGIFHYGYTGYLDSPAALLSQLEDRDVTQLIISQGRTKRNFYLKGNTCDSYVGNSWETNRKEETISSQTDTLMTLYAVFDYTRDKEELRKFLEVHEQKITFGNIRTQSLFYPLKLIDTTEADMLYEGDNIRADKINARGHTYSYRFVDIDYASPDLIHIMSNSKNITYNEESYDLIFEKMKEYYDIELKKMPYREFLTEVSKGQNGVVEQYSVLGDAVSKDVIRLAHTITEDCRNDYEKCKALERYLYQYHYNKKPDVPDNVNVLDWFLFEGKEGYCVHYATALAVMLRCEAIPARVAEGFLVDYKDRIDFYSYEVSGRTAHVWVEAYLEGFGWIRLEPTAVNAGNANAVWYTEPLYEEEDKPREENETGEEAITNTEEIHQKEEPGNIWFLVFVMLGGMAVIIIAVFLFLWIHKKIRIRKSNDPDVIWRQLLLLLGKEYSPKEEVETVREYLGRISCNEQMTKEMRGNLLMILTFMEEYWYGEGNIREHQLKMMKEVRDGFS